jgi:hypothetical protein
LEAKVLPSISPRKRAATCPYLCVYDTMHWNKCVYIYYIIYIWILYIYYYTCICLYMCIQCIYSISYMSISNYIFMYPIWKCQREVNIYWVHDPLATGIRYDEYGSRPKNLVPWPQFWVFQAETLIHPILLTLQIAIWCTLW